MNMCSRKVLIRGAWGFAALLVLIQLVPYGRNHSTPATVSEPAWDSPATLGLAKAACFDCHSNQTVWPPVSAIAPVSWLVYYDVVEGRKELNFSDWQGGQRAAGRISKIREEVNDGEMPPLIYRAMHPAARLTDAEKEQLLSGLATTLGGK